ncbi:MAG: alpha/beta fold hydrolase [Nevskia sp.]|nr:alpha/beta fold hydrolase [Nevskia sp.]
MAAAQKLHVNGIDLNVLVDGKGPEVLLLHGFPDSHAVWRLQIPALVAAGYRVIAPDLRGYGQSDAPAACRDYAMPQLLGDVVGLLDALQVSKVRLVGHDWGAALGWQLCMAYPERVDRYVALSVGHPRAYAGAPLRQKLMGSYILFFQLRGLAEFVIRCCRWRLFRALIRYDAECERWIADLSRPGRLTAALNWYRANLRMILPRNWPAVEVPVLGVWSSRDIALCEAQMTASERYVDAAWSYARLDGVNHWLQLDAPERVNALLLGYLH